MSIYDELNHTELVALAKFNGLNGYSRAIPQDIIIGHLKKYEDIEEVGPLTKVREDLAGWVSAYWDSCLRMQVQDAGISNKGITCSDIQMLNYYFSNEKGIKLWKATKKRV